MTWLRLRGPDLSLWIVFGLIIVFLYLPLIIVVMYSFHGDEVMTWPLESPTLHWYQEFFTERYLVTATLNSIKVAVASIVIGLALGVPAAFAIDRFEFRGKSAFQRLMVLPFVLPAALGGIVLLTLFLAVGVQLSLTTVIVAHATLVTAAVVLQTTVGLQRWDRTYEMAAMDLGANGVRTFLTVILPNLNKTLLGAVLLGLTLSLDEVARTFFVTGTDNTLPMQVWAMIKQGTTPVVNVAATLLFGLSVILLGIWTALVRD